MRVFAALFAWRDRVARDEDESTRSAYVILEFYFLGNKSPPVPHTRLRYVLPNHQLFHIAELMPTDAPSLLQCCNPIPPLVKQQTADLVLLVQRARDPTDATVSTLEQRPAPAGAPPFTYCLRRFLHFVSFLPTLRRLLSSSHQQCRHRQWWPLAPPRGPSTRRLRRHRRTRWAWRSRP